VLNWLELTPDYKCNNRCVGCFSVQDEGGQGAITGDKPPLALGQGAITGDKPPLALGQGPTMSVAEAVQNLALGRRQGARALWLGGGEPTLRGDLLAIVGAARRMGYERVKLQTNGMRLAYPDFTRQLAEAGVTEINFAIKGARADTHNRLTRTPGCHGLLLDGISEARKRGMAMEGDILVYRSNAAEIPEMVRFYSERGIARFNLWLLSVTDHANQEVVAEAPRITDVMPHIVSAMDLALSERPDFITSLHTPPCTVPSTHRACLFHAPELGLMVTNPGGYRFMLEQSPIEGGTYFEGCSGCRDRARCGGARADYVALFGNEEFQPLI
jgi:MoaA/NifB/PqqE/SkfB family radical SAM enzyme